MKEVEHNASAADLRSLTNREIARMPVDRLALLVLADVDRTTPWNWRNWMLTFSNSREPDDLDDMQNALAEAWGWLTARGLVSTNGARGSYDFHDVHITRAGRAAFGVRPGLRARSDPA